MAEAEPDVGGARNGATLSTVLSPTLDTLIVTIHVLAASVWVGGQIVLAGMIGSVRRVHPDATGVVAKAFGRVAWPAFVVLVLTGMWSLVRIDVVDTTSAYQVTLLAKLALAVASGAAAAVHAVGQTKVAIALGGAVGLVTALGAVYTGVLLAGAA